MSNCMDGFIICPNCGGSGFISIDAPLSWDADDIMDPDVCLYCNGTGSVPRNEAHQ